MRVEQIAVICHEANRAYCATLGDFSQKPWEEASDGIRQSAIDGVMKHIQNPDLTPEQSHQSWLDFKAGQGWKYGPVKDEAAKTHPSFRPYGELPAAEQAKDSLFKAIVGALRPFVTGTFLPGT